MLVPRSNRRRPLGPLSGPLAIALAARVDAPAGETTRDPATELARLLDLRSTIELAARLSEATPASAASVGDTSASSHRLEELGPAARVRIEAVERELLLRTERWRAPRGRLLARESVRKAVSPLERNRNLAHAFAEEAAKELEFALRDVRAIRTWLGDELRASDAALARLEGIDALTGAAIDRALTERLLAAVPAIARALERELGRSVASPATNPAVPALDAAIAVGSALDHATRAFEDLVRGSCALAARRMAALVQGAQRTLAEAS